MLILQESSNVNFQEKYFVFLESGPRVLDSLAPALHYQIITADAANAMDCQETTCLFRIICFSFI